MKLKMFFLSCFAIVFSFSFICSAEYIPETYIYEAETASYLINGEEAELAPVTEDDITYISYAGEKNGNITFKFDVAESGRYEINIKTRRRYDANRTAAYTWKVDDADVKYLTYYDKTNAQRFFMDKWQNIDLGQFDLEQGEHTLSVLCAFTYASWNGTELDIDAIEIKKSNSNTLFLYNEYQDGKVTASIDGGISKVVANDFYSTVLYEAKNPGEYISVNFETETCGVFNFDVVVKAGGSTSGVFNVYLDDVLMCEKLDFSLSKYGSEWNSIPFGTSELSAGKHNIKFVVAESSNGKRALLSEIKLNAVCEGAGVFAPEIQDEKGELNEITQLCDIKAVSSIYNYEDGKDYLIVFLYYDKTSGVGVLKDVAMNTVTVNQGECKFLECPMSITEMYTEGEVKAFVCDYTEGIIYTDTEVVTIPCKAN